MAGPIDQLTGFAQLHTLENRDERVRAFRRGMANLAAAAQEQRPVPLEGTPTDDLLAGARVVLSDRLLSDLSWLSRPAAATAMYQFAMALPPSVERDTLTLHAFEISREGDAATFVAFATALAVGTRRSFDMEWMRPRVALSLALPIGSGIPVDTLAMALVCRRDLAQQWLVEPSIGSLPSRRMAAKLLERAAREAVRRHSQGDDGGLRVFEDPAVRAAWKRLLKDRESLVWRHVASARGLLSGAVPELAQEIERDLDVDLSPTEWRRAVASLSASIAVDPKRAVTKSRAILSTEIFRKDRGLAGAMILGMARAGEVEPEAVESLLSPLIELGGTDAAEALVELRREFKGSTFGLEAAERACRDLRKVLDSDAGRADIGRAAALDVCLRELSAGVGESASRPNLSTRLRMSLDAFVRAGADAALASAVDALSIAESAVRTLEQGVAQADDSLEAQQALIDLDTCMLQSSTLSELLALGEREEHEHARERLRQLRTRVGAFLYQREHAVVTLTQVAHPSTHMRRLVTWLHLLDADEVLSTAEPAVAALLSRCGKDAAQMLNRVVSATCARGCDSLVRAGALEISDVLLNVSSVVQNPRTLRAMGEASMVPELEVALNALATLHEQAAISEDDSVARRRALDSLKGLADALPPALSPRVEALRHGLITLYRSLESIAAARALAELNGGGENSPLGALEVAIQTLVRLSAGAGGRVRNVAPSAQITIASTCVRALSLALESSVGRSTPPLLSVHLQGLAKRLPETLPPAIAEITLRVLRAMQRLPLHAQPGQANSLPPPPRMNALPAWLPPSRVLGGFYVQQGLGEGAGGSVYVVTRVDERHKPNARRYALKVPMYDGTAARTLSEAEFLALFREEAGALLSLPQNHPNLAGFVTFDAGANPKPLLVMELVEGPSLARIMQRGNMDTDTALGLLDGVASGLDTMHKLGIGHLDLKPANVILREQDKSASDAVLVDFGLSGRRVRPGCATANYGAPEVWGMVPPGHVADAAPADVYAFSCLAYELLTGRELFGGGNDMALISAHITHDGFPQGVLDLAGHPVLGPVAEVLASGLRQDPRQRATITQIRNQLRALRPVITRPLAAAG